MEQIFDIFLVFVSRHFELGRVSVQFANAFAIAITFARWRRRSESTAVTYGTNFLSRNKSKPTNVTSSHGSKNVLFLFK